MTQWNSTGNGRWLGGAALVAALGFAGCGDDGGTEAGPTGGSAGKGGAGSGGTSAGKGGNAGTPGKGGSANVAGVGGSGGVTGGQAGSAGEGGAAPEGGEGGAAPEGGMGGEAGSPFPELSPLPAVPADPTNRVADSALAATFGQRLFFDEKFSGALKIDSDLGTTGQTARVSCASCHDTSAQGYFDDTRSDPATVSIGVGLHTRNSPTLVNSSFYTWTNWGGRFSAQWELPLAVAESGVIMSGNRLALAHRIFDVYKADYEAIFGALTPEIGSDAVRFPPAGKPKPVTDPVTPDGAWEGMTDPDRVIINTILVNYSKSIAAYMRLLVSREAPFDAWVAGESAAIDASAERGAWLFIGKAGCVSCHSGPHLSDGGFHDLGVPQTGANVPATDDGRFKDVPALLGSPFNRNGAYSDKKDTGLLDGLTNPMPDSAKGAFRTPSLRGVDLTAPYMHSGQLATLEAVVDFYDAGGGVTADDLEPLNLTSGEKADLVAFMKTLTGKPVPAALRLDTAAP